MNLHGLPDLKLSGRSSHGKSIACAKTHPPSTRVQVDPKKPAQKEEEEEEEVGKQCFNIAGRKVQHLFVILKHEVIFVSLLLYY